MNTHRTAATALIASLAGLSLMFPSVVFADTNGEQSPNSGDSYTALSPTLVGEPTTKVDTGTQTDSTAPSAASVTPATPTDTPPKTAATPPKGPQDPKRARSIDNAIRSLSYDRNAVLSFNGEKVESFIPKEGQQRGDKFIVIKRQKRSLSTSPSDISVVDSTVDRSYPGALQLANRSLVENKPTLLQAERAPLDISISLPGLHSDNTIRVENPRYSTVQAAIDTLIDRWSDRSSATHTLPAKMQYNESMVHNKSQISAALNVNAEFLNKTLGLNFKAISEGEKQVMIAAFKQIFYTVNADLPTRPSDLFGPSVRAKDLRAAGMNNDNPPVMVNNVAYGRTIYVKLETTSKSNDVEAAFKALLEKVQVEGSSKYSEILNNSTFTAYALGGDAKSHSQVISKDFDQIRKLIHDGSEFSTRNPGYPISYTATFLKDNSIATVNNTAEYVETVATEYQSGKVVFDHSGAYVAQFAVEWDEISFDKDGNEILTHKGWQGNWRDRTAHYSTIIPLPANAKNVRIVGREATGLFWNWWRTVVNERHVPLAKTITVKVWGTTLYPRSSIKFED